MHRGFWVLALKFGNKEKVQDLQPLEWQTQYNRPCSVLTLLAEARAITKPNLQGGSLSVDNFNGSGRLSSSEPQTGSILMV